MPLEPEDDPAHLSVKELGVATLLFAVLVLILAYPVSLHPLSQRIDMGSDTHLGWYILSWDTHAFLHRPWDIFHANIFYPKPYALAYGENIIGLAFLAAPVLWLTGDASIASTWVSLSTCVLCGLGAYVLARRVGLSVAAALVCGAIFECTPPRFFRIGQLTLTGIQWVPFALASAHAYLDRGRRRDLLATTAFVTLQVLSSGHGAVFVSLSLVLLGVYRVLLGEPLRIAGRIRDLGVTGALLLLPSALIFIPYRRIQESEGLHRGLGTWDTPFAAFLSSPTYLHQWILKQFGATTVLKTDPTLFPGYLALGLGAAALLWPRRDGVARWQRLADVSATAAFALEVSVMGAAVIATVLTAAHVFDLHVGTIWVESLTSARVPWVVFLAGSCLGIVWGRHTTLGSLARLGWPFALVVLAALGLATLGDIRPRAGAGDGLVAEYFASPDWQGHAEATATDTIFSPAWMTRRWDGSPPEAFSVRWTGFLTITRPGTYTFTLTSDDGSQLWIDGESVVDNSGRHSASTRPGHIGLLTGAHAVELRYAQFGGESELRWSWSGGWRGADTAVPRWALSTRPASVRQATLARVLDALQRALLLVVVPGLVWLIWRWVSGTCRRVVPQMAARHRGDARTFYALLTAATFALALGPPYGLWPYVYWMPVFNFIRVSSRFTLLTVLGLAVLAGIGFDALTRRRTARYRAVAAALLLCGLVIEYAAMPTEVPPPPPRLTIPAIDRWLNTQPKPFVIAEVPVHGESDQTDYMMHSTTHWQPTVQGYHGWRSGLHIGLNEEMLTFPDDRSLTHLSELGVTFVVVHTDRYTPEERRRFEEGANSHRDRLLLVHEEAEGRVYRVTRRTTRVAN